MSVLFLITSANLFATISLIQFELTFIAFNDDVLANSSKKTTSSASSNLQFAIWTCEISEVPLFSEINAFILIPISNRFACCMVKNSKEDTSILCWDNWSRCSSMFLLVKVLASCFTETS